MRKYKIVLFYIHFVIILMTVIFNIGCVTRTKKSNNLNSTSIIKPMELKKDSEFLYSENSYVPHKINEHVVFNNNTPEIEKKPNYNLPLIWLLVMLPVSTVIFSFLRNMNLI